MKQYLFADFIFDKRAGIDGKTKAMFTQTQSEYPLKVICSREHMDFGGVKIKNDKDLEDFAKFVTQCWSEHKKLAPRISPTGVIE